MTMESTFQKIIVVGLLFASWTQRSAALPYPPSRLSVERGIDISGLPGIDTSAAAADPFQPSKFSTSLLNGTSVFDSQLGSIQQITAKELPELTENNLSVQRLVLSPKAVRAPSWTTNCATLTYCVSGQLFVSILDTQDVFAGFTIDPGQMFTVASGSIWYVENIGNDTAELITAFRNPQPEEVSLWASLGAFTPAVIGNTYTSPATDWTKIRPSDTKPQWIIAASNNSVSTLPTTKGIVDAHKFDIGAQPPPVDFPYGTAGLARTQYWPLLKDINMAMYLLSIKTTGMREIHWQDTTPRMHR